METDEVMDAAQTASEAWDLLSPLVDFAREHWLALALTGEIVGAVIAIKLGRYWRGTAWLLAALATVWAGAVV